MTLVADPHAPPVPRWARVWGLPVWAHLLALGAVLLLLVPVVGPSHSFIADEGAAIIQATSLEAGGGWIVEHPLPEVDPEGRWYPVVNAERGAKGFAPLAKHPLYPTLAAAAARVGGVAGMVVLSLFGTVGAAGLAAALAGRLDTALVRPTVWVVGLASPLLFDGFLVMGHTLGAALATAAVLAAVVAVQDRRPVVAVLVAPAVGGAVLLRNEALLFAAALIVVSGLLALRRAYRSPAAMVAAATVAGAIGARLLDRLWMARVTGGAVSTTAVGVPAAGDGFVEGRIDGFLTTWLTPGYGDLDLGTLALLVMLAAIASCALRVRSHPDGRSAILGRAGVAAVAAVVAVAVDPGNVVPGLLLAFPVATAGMLAVRRTLFDDAGAVVIGATALLFALAVIATQYAVGGSGEWGGRYFALVVPAAVPLLLAALRAEGRSLAADVRRGVAVVLVVCSAALSVMAVGSLRANHRAAARVVARIEAAGRLTGDARPVVVTDWVAGARLAWPTFDDHRWLYVTRGGMAQAVERLGAAGIDRFVFVGDDVASMQAELAGLTVIGSDVPPKARQILVLER